MRPGLRRDTRFYIAFGERHKYTDGTRYGEPAESCLDLRFLRRGEPIDGGVDFGNQLSLIVGQQDGPLYRLHKNFTSFLPDGSGSWPTSSWHSSLTMRRRN